MKRYFYPITILNKPISVLFVVLAFLFSLSVTAQPYNAFQPTDGPAGGAGGADANSDDPDPNGIEVGVKFKVSQSGQINGVRFYKGTSNTGTHIGHLWSSSGTLLSTITFSGETAGGWQQMNFASAVSVNPGVVYTASVYMDLGIYPVTGGFFSSPIINDGIELIANGDPDGPNGIYDYTAAPLSAPPTSTFGGGNYWIDVAFTPFFPLPVTLSDFKAITTNNNVALTWKTNSENNNAGFEIQRSNNSSDWYSIGFVDGAGESSTVQYYSYTDKSLAPGLYYYRLGQKDLDGQVKNSSVVTATISGRGIVSLYQNSPNPVKGSTSIRFDLPELQKIKLSIFDMAGREVKVLADQTEVAGTHQVNFSTDGLGRQMYIIKLQTENSVLTKKMLVE